MGSIDRRAFLKGAIATGAGAVVMSSLAACANGAGGDAGSAADGEGGEVTGREPKFSFDTPPDPIPESDIVETKECEVLVVGGGVAGSAAAARASELSDSVQIIESGYSWGLPRSATTGFGSEVQKSMGYEFTDELRHQVILDTYMISGRYQSRIDLIANYIDYSGSMCDWIKGIYQAAGGDLTVAPPWGNDSVEEKGVAVATIATPSASGGTQLTDYYGSFELSHTPVGPADEETGEDWSWVAALGEYALANGAAVDFQTKGVRLERDDVQDGKSGRVTAVIAQNADGQYVRYKASKGIILAVGDYMQDKEMLQKYAPLALNNFCDFSNIWCDGAMQKAAMWCGATMDTMASLDAWPGQTITGKCLRPDPKEGPLWAMSSGWSWNPAVASFPMLYLTTGGERFTNEETENGTGCMRMANCLCSVCPGGYAWSIWDSAWETKFEGIIPSVTPFCINTPEEVEIDIAEGLTYKCESIEEIAEVTGMPLDVLQESIDEYNAVCASGDDRKFLKNPMWLKPIDTPPYYVAGIGMGIECVRGGLTMDGKLRVIDAEGKAIEGLYAVGNTGGSFYGNVYPSMVGGTGTGHGMTFGMLAAEEIMGQSRLHG